MFPGHMTQDADVVELGSSLKKAEKPGGVGDGKRCARKGGKIILNNQVTKTQS
jgi:hypothetical protein